MKAIATHFLKLQQLHPLINHELLTGKMKNNPNQPGKFDAVLGGQAPPPAESVVLGGVEGVKDRLKSTVVKARIAAVSEALNYGEIGLDLMIEALKDSASQVRRSAYRLLREKGGNKGKQALLDYDPWLFFTTFQDWKAVEFDPRVGITEPESTAYVVNIDQLKLLLQTPQATEITALKCHLIDGAYYEVSDEFYTFLDILVDASKQLSNLKALFIGDIDEDRYRKSRRGLSDISLILESYPNLELLQVRGFCYELECSILCHENLKTLIVETSVINDMAIYQICSLNLPALEYFELWLGRGYEQNINNTIDTLKPILFSESFPKLSYLGLRSSDYADEIASAVAESFFMAENPIIDHLAVLDLSMGNLTDSGLQNLLDQPEINQLHTLNISNNCVSLEMINNLSSMSFRLITDSQEELYDRNSGRSRYHTLHE